jgi:hypothetical protein
VRGTMQRSPKFFMDMRPASVVCNSRQQTIVRAKPETVLILSLIDAAAVRHPGDREF